MFIVLVEWKVAPSSADAFRDLVLLQAKNSVQEEAGCRLFDVGQKPDAPNQFMLYEIYDSEKEFDAHRQTKHYAEFSSAVEIMTELLRVSWTAT